MNSDAKGTIEFWKYSGAGNDFIIVDLLDTARLGEASAHAQALCQRATSVGADGFVLVSEPGSQDPGCTARMQLWNADGSSAEFSGNAARCALRYLADEGRCDGKAKLATDIGIVDGWVDGSTVGVHLPGPAIAVPNRRIRVEGRDVVGTEVAAGVPFFVLFCDDPDDLPVRFLGRAIRHHEALEPAGANVAFVRVDSEQELYFRVYERGVEDETLSSGTGSISAAVAAAAANLVESPVSCQARGGTLTVRFNIASPSSTSTPACDSKSFERQHDETVSFDQIAVEGETRRVMRATAFPDALQLN